MAGNKYPEETVKIILDAALKVFLEKGCEKATVLDIVAEMKGLTRGAFYHHFKSKEEVLFALIDNMFDDINPFKKIKRMKELNGLEKIRRVFSEFNASGEYFDLQLKLLPLLKDPVVLKIVLDNQRDFTAPMLAGFIEEGTADGSIKVKNPKLAAELFMLLANFWIIPSIFPVATETEAEQKFEMIKTALEAIGLPVFGSEQTASIEADEINYMKATVQKVSQNETLKIDK